MGEKENIGILKYFESDVVKEKYKIMILDGKVDCLQILEVEHNYKAEYQRWDVKTHKATFKKAFYVLAKHKPEKFKVMYQELKNNDPEFFEIAKKALMKIKVEYDFE